MNTSKMAGSLVMNCGFDEAGGSCLKSFLKVVSLRMHVGDELWAGCPNAGQLVLHYKPVRIVDHRRFVHHENVCFCERTILHGGIRGLRNPRRYENWSARYSCGGTPLSLCKQALAYAGLEFCFQSFQTKHASYHSVN